MHVPRRDGRERSISPVGTSRFEKPFVPPPVVHLVSSTPASAAASPTSPISAGTNFGKPSRQTTAHDSLFSRDAREMIHTAPTSVASEENIIQSPKNTHFDVANPDEWFSRFHSDDDLGGSVSDECPDRATLAAVQDIQIYNAEGVAAPFSSLYDPDIATHQRQLIIFVRHFYCGACHAYLQALTQSITMRDYFSIPTPTNIIVIGCGQPDLIPHYKNFTNCPFPMFADPSRQLFKKLGMVLTANLGGTRPEYMKDISIPAWAAGQVKSVAASLKDADGIRKRDVLRGGNPFQIGGEFLFEDGQVIWCHRMKNMRNHAEIKVLRKLLELDEV